MITGIIIKHLFVKFNYQMLAVFKNPFAAKLRLKFYLPLSVTFKCNQKVDLVTCHIKTLKQNFLRSIEKYVSLRFFKIFLWVIVSLPSVINTRRIELLIDWLICVCSSRHSIYFCLNWNTPIRETFLGFFLSLMVLI